MAEPAHGGGGPFSFAHVLFEELRHLGRYQGPPRAPRDPDAAAAYSAIGSLPDEEAPTALCLSGGGIRSATFNLGVLQALAQRGLLTKFDYLSSVSGGGFIAGWLAKWAHLASLPKVCDLLADPKKQEAFDPLHPEPGPLDYLRQYSNYLTPRLGLFSADTWAAAALIVRNVLLNWLVLVPVLAAVVAVPQLSLLVVAGSPLGCPGQPIPTAAWGRWAFYAAVGLAAWTSAALHYLRRRRDRPATEMSVLVLGVLPLWLSSLCFAQAALWLRAEFYDDGTLWAVSLLWCLFIPLFGWAFARVAARGIAGLPRDRADLAGIVLSGTVVAAVLVAITRAWLPYLREHTPLFVILAVPVLLGLYLLARSLFVAFASLGERDHVRPETTPNPATPPPGELGFADREWWARLSGWVLLGAMTWMGLSTVVVLGYYLASTLSGQALTMAGGISGLVTALLGAYAGTSARKDEEGPESSALAGLAVKLLAPLAVVSILIGLAQLNALIAAWLTGLSHRLLVVKNLSWQLSLPEGVRFGADVLLPCVAGAMVLVVLSWLLGFVVNVNRFSAHGLYRNRLVRAYLGASNRSRTPDPFTGFDPGDNLPLHQLVKGASRRPLAVINAALNLVQGSKLAWQQRKAASFSMTPLFCGNFHEGYRASSEYGGPDGISLGTAVTTSGAAANPNAGYHSSPVVSFLMALFNVRLGCWLGNTNEHGEAVYRKPGPRHAWKSLLADLLGLTSETHPYVSLSDGGHFENLGIYEMVLRRCRYIVAVDAGQDERHELEDLGNVVRKVRVDFGIRIRFDDPIAILPRDAKGRGLACAIGTIHYEDVDGKVPSGRLVYLKPTLRAGQVGLPYDVFSYARASKGFPHEPTGDQWFDEAQFESYRALGRSLALDLPAASSLPDLAEAVQKKLEAAAAGGAVLEI